MIAVRDDDYIIADYRGKPTLLFVLNAKAKRCVIEKTLITDEPEHITIQEEHIHCNLGQEPLTGKAFGIDIKPYIKTIETKKFGPIHVFRKLEKGELRGLKKAMNRVYKLYAEKATVSFFPLYAINIEPKKGKYAGSYKFRQKGLDAMDEMYLHPETFTDIEFNTYMLAHECAHGLWFRCVPTDIRSKWLNLYQKRLQLSTIESSELEQLCEDVIQYNGNLGDYCKEVGDDYVKMIVKEVLAYFKRYHHMDQRAVELMLAENSPKLASIWPSSTKLTEERPDISEYSLKNVEEFFAEAMANYMIGKQLPKDVQKGIDFTIKRLKSYA